MKNLRTRSCALLCSSAVLALACGSALAADTGGSRNARTVYQQRLPDGSLLLTDHRPYGSEDNLLEQSWNFPAEDPEKAAARRAEVRAEHEAVTERIHQMLAQRERLSTELALERMRQATLRDALKAEHADAPRHVGSTVFLVPVWPGVHSPRP